MLLKKCRSGPSGKDRFEPEGKKGKKTVEQIN